ncbi:RdgB/HAM1 family non-canonical purine NTP pyrophosphatase [Candidatus Kinetoplastidibacterium crithidiae]|uniref:dITP/XTP pyrophosphatase n=1 Tax=Candidatus Kinetoplastidibacterium crithidiae TCC036E TaxID=1208918 RepID=M1L4L9_9PROT|nr:RdgB/HAM1 family non-canonical purine NTP pyrophosphatase [Candidatus Kinetoplastibacterium crithidii]AFZ82703.1 nucleoside-triphosphatase [Candidatus Kinetoplastibacterium crithidii (ex Angomonas deanei ATCC 30255)]AGF47643.1 nucleoside-triphosphatase [Candidatus Kinetoplastibacterium crithidii TCC036E]
MNKIDCINNKLVIASSNKEKLIEITSFFKDFDLSIYLQSDFGIHTNDERNNTFIENALNKARHVSRLTGLPSLAEDSGLCVNSLSGAPGIFSARYSSFSNKENSDSKLNNELLIKNLKGLEDRRAYYISIVVILRNPNDHRPLITEGILHGEIVEKASGNNGFGYDPHFFVPSIGKTLASITLSEKNKISHRAKAFEKMIQKLKFTN